MTEQVRKLKTRCYYTDYVNHMVRFYLSTPETLQMEGKRKADIENWIAVQDVWHKLGTDDKNILEQIYKAHYRLAEGVRIYCGNTATDPYEIWKLITRIHAAIAKRRGLI